MPGRGQAAWSAKVRREGTGKGDGARQEPQREKTSITGVLRLRRDALAATLGKTQDGSAALEARCVGRNLRKKRKTGVLRLRRDALAATLGKTQDGSATLEMGFVSSSLNTHRGSKVISVLIAEDWVSPGNWYLARLMVS